MRASAIAERCGIPSATICLTSFIGQAAATAKGQGIPNLPLAEYPGVLHLHSDEEIERNVENVLVENVIRALTTQTQAGETVDEPGQRDIVLRGDLTTVQDFFHRNRWTDGTPVIPPTIDKVEEFLRCTDRARDDVIGVLLPAQREASVWTVAVNGVMAGCRPEYMPVLLAVTEVMADPDFGLKHLGHTPGSEALITINGPIIKQLGFNCGVGALRVGHQANTSIGRFYRLIMTNVARFILGETDKGTFGGTWKVVLAENDDAVKRIGWQPTAVELGFSEDDSVVTIRSVAAMSAAFASTGDKAEHHLRRIADMMAETQQGLMVTIAYHETNWPQIIISPCVAEVIAKGGYSKDDVKQYMYDHARLPAWRLEELIDAEFHLQKPLTLVEFAKRGTMPSHFGESDDPNRLVPTVWDVENFTITVSGDPERNRCMVCLQNADPGKPTTKKVKLPAKWETLLANTRG